MKKIILGILFLNLLIYAKTYEVPPSSSLTISGDVISDEKMEECVKLYNEAKWLYEDINSMSVNRYNSNEVKNYNNKVERHRKMIQKFNAECAGKESYSAWKAAQKLNKGQ
jgi:uncharacterized membrane protein